MFGGELIIYNLKVLLRLLIGYSKNNYKLYKQILASKDKCNCYP